MPTLLTLNSKLTHDFASCKWNNTTSQTLTWLNSGLIIDSYSKRHYRTWETSTANLLVYATSLHFPTVDVQYVAVQVT